MSSDRHLRHIGYLVKTFPKISETFILQEILELERQGIALTIFSLYPPSDSEVHSSVSPIQSPVYYLNGSVGEPHGPALHAHQWLIKHNPNRYIATLQNFQRRTEGMLPSEFYFARELAVHLLQLKIAHLHAHFANEPTSVAELTHHLTGIPFSFTAHAKDIYLTDGPVLQRKIESADFVVTCTDYNRRYLENISGNGSPIHLVYHGLDLTKFQNRISTEISSPQNPLRILSIGRFREKKGFVTLLQACRVLRDAGVVFDCQIVGYGPLQPTLEKIIAEEQLSDLVWLVGKQSQEQVIERYQQATMFVLPCQIGEDGDRDGIPNVLLEAMAMGLPVITTNVSGIPELVQDKTNGLLVQPQAPEELATAMARILQDPTLRQQLGENGRDTVAEKFSSTHHITKLLNLLMGNVPCQPPSLILGNTQSQGQ